MKKIKSISFHMCKISPEYIYNEKGENHEAKKKNKSEKYILN
jgi:hypothetical protein